ncbi:hypothetical protein Glove_407g2 [Diversispora epigaea]|uniref:RING-type domain-containing protein n=1 Tax=Diversispora epigaea TaxID=1348612 RepID=A0A397GYE0_9GLOM|nr:hypothetical protein Glove_407g2 [Diversispora epigaea]
MSARDMLTECGLNFINWAETSENWLKLSKFYLEKYLRRYLLIPGYDIKNKDQWENFIFRVKNNLYMRKQIAYNPEFREFKKQLAETAIIIIISKMIENFNDHAERKVKNEFKYLKDSIIDLEYGMRMFYKKLENIVDQCNYMFSDNYDYNSNTSNSETELSDDVEILTCTSKKIHESKDHGSIHSKPKNKRNKNKRRIEERPNSANVSQLKTLSLNFLQNISEISNEEEVPKLKERPNSANVSQLKTLSLNFLQNISEISNEEEVPKLSPCQKCGKEILAFPLRAFVVLSCEHIFHRTCIEQHIVRIDKQVPTHPSCPICSTIIEVIREEGTLGSDKYQMVPKIRSLIDFEKKASQQSTDTVEDDPELEYMRELGLMGNASTQDQTTSLITNISVTAQEQDTSPMCLELETRGEATGTNSIISNEKGTTTVVQVNPSDQDSANETTDSTTSPLKRNSVSEPAIAVNAKEEFRPHKVPRINSTSVESDKKEKESNVLKGFIEELTADSSEVFKDLPLDGNEDDFLYLYNRITNAEAHSEIANQEVIRCYYSLGKVLSQRFKYHFEKSYNEHTAQIEVNKEFGDRLPGNITKTTIRKKAERARKIYMLFCDNREGMIRRVQTYSAISISKLSVDDIAYVISQIKIKSPA